MIQSTKLLVLRAIVPMIALSSLSLVGSPMVTLSDNAALYFNGSASMTSDSNIGYASENEIDDIILEIRPGLELVSGNPETGADFSLLASYGIRKYMDNDEFDGELPTIIGEANFTSPKSKTTVSASYIESQSENRRYNVPGLVLKTSIAKAGIRSDFKPTAKSSVVAALSYSDTDHENYGSDYSDISIPLNYYYAATEKLDAGFGYRYRNTSVDRSIYGDRTSHFVNVALRGELTPKMVADVKVGFQSTDVDNGESVDGLAFDAALTFIADAKTSADISFSKDLAVGFAGDVIDNTTFAVGGNYQFTDAFAGNATVVFGNDSFESYDREDDYTVFQVGVSYIPVYYMSVEAAYMLMDNDSDVLEFTKNTFTLMVNVRY